MKPLIIISIVLVINFDPGLRLWHFWLLNLSKLGLESPWKVLDIVVNNFWKSCFQSAAYYWPFDHSIIPLNLIMNLDYFWYFGAFWSAFFFRWAELKKKSPLTWWKNPSWSSFWKPCWTACVSWRAASENAREGKSADWLSSVHCCSDWLCQASLWGPWSRWSVLSVASSPPLHPPLPPTPASRAHKHAQHQQLPPRATVASSLRQSRASAAMGTSAWANEQHLFLSSVAVHANHNTHFIWPLSCSQSQHVIHGHLGHERHRQKRNMDFIAGERTFQKMTFPAQMSQQMCSASLHHWKKVSYTEATFW